MAGVLAGPALTAGLRAEFVDTYRFETVEIEGQLSGVMQFGVPSDKLTEIYSYPETAPYPRRWPRGQNISRDAFRYVQFSVTNHDWAHKIDWHENDRLDDQTDSLMQQARDGGAHWASLPERIFFQIITATVDLTLLPAVPNAPDGAALYATTAAGANRFGVTNGNLLPGTGIATAAAVRADFFNAIEQMRLFRDTKDQPLLPNSVFRKEFSVFFNVANLQVFLEAFVQGRTIDSAAAGAAETNIILDSGLKINLRPTPRLTDNDWYVFAEGVTQKAIFEQERKPLRTLEVTMDGNISDESRQTKQEWAQWDSREGYGVRIPYQTVKINN